MNAHAMTAASTSGVQGYSSSSAFESYAIFCVGNNIAKEAAFRAWATAQDIGFKSLIGSYKGVTEASFIVNRKDLGRCYEWWKDEESVLLLGPRYRMGPRGLKMLYGNCEAQLAYHPYRPPAGFEQIGLFHEASREYALKQDSWTYDPSSKTYYVCTPEPTNSPS